VTCDVRLDDVDPASGALLGWVVREGATNVLRHARPRRCTLRIGAGAGTLVLELTNDGAGAASPDGTGTGLRGLDARLGHAGGRLWSVREPDGTFRLHAELPALVTA
jgi:two-component system sensor histidine kinase DesK